MFGGIGTDTIELSKYFNVITTEMDPYIYSLLKRNISNYRCKNINILHLNCLALLPIIKPDIIYFDPPWGHQYKVRSKIYQLGSKATQFDFSQVYLDFPTDDVSPQLPKKISCTDLVLYLYEHVTKNIIIKAPLNSTSFEQLFNPYHAIKYIFKSNPHYNLKFIYLV